MKKKIASLAQKKFGIKAFNPLSFSFKAGIIFFVPIIVVTFIISLIFIVVFMWYIYDQTETANAEEGICIPVKITGEKKSKTVNLTLKSNGIETKNIIGTISDNGKSFTAKNNPNMNEKQINSKTVDTSTVQGQVWAFLKKDGYSDEAAAGIMGNIEQESSFKPANSGNGVACGLFQLERCNNKGSSGSGRFLSMKKYCEKKGKTWTNVQCQLEYFKGAFSKQLKAYSGNGIHTYPNGTETWWPTRVTVTQFKSLKNIKQATEIFERTWERPSIPDRATRLAAAKKYYKQYTGKSIIQNVTITGTIKNNKITITGTVDGEELTADGTITNNKIEAKGQYGDGCVGYGQFSWPMKQWSFGRGWGLFTDSSGYDHYHQGIDVSSGSDYSIYSVADGTVVEVHNANSDSSGKYLMVKHGDIYVRYQHLAKISVKEDQKITRGEKIAIQGSTCGPDCEGAIHLHFEVWKKWSHGTYTDYTSGNTVDPLKYFPKNSKVPEKWYDYIGKQKPKGFENW